MNQTKRSLLIAGLPILLFGSVLLVREVDVQRSQDIQQAQAAERLQTQQKAEITRLVKQLKQTSEGSEAFNRTVSALTELSYNNPSVVSTLLPLLKDPNPAIRAKGVAAIGFIN